MAQKTFTIELRVHHDEPSTEKDDIIRQVVIQAAKHVLTTALLIADRRKPEIAVSAGDMFAGVDKISMAEDLVPPDEIKIPTASGGADESP